MPSKIEKRQAVEKIDRLIYSSMESRRRDPQPVHDVLSMLLNLRDTEGDGGGLSDKQIRDEAITLFNAGHDSTAAALSWAWYLLMKNPHAYDKLLAESDARESSKFATQVAKETLRLYPPAWTLPRKCLESTEIGGYHIPRDSLINFFPYIMHRDERFFHEPENFRPERFDETNEAQQTAFAYFPFGAGPRACIGREMALLEMQLILSTIAQRFRFELAPGQENIEPNPLVSLEQKTGVKAVVTRR